MLAEILRRQPTSPAKIECAWRLAAGTAFARAAQVQWAEDGTLRVDVADPAWRREVQRARPMLVERLRGLLGDAAISRLVIVDPGRTRPSRPSPHA
jgi:hypothetical protein